MTPTPTSAAPAQQPSALPIVALVLGCLGCVPLLGCIGAVLGVVGIIAALRNPAFGRLGMSIGATVAGVVWLSGLTLIAVPNFIRFQSRSKQSECKTNLKGAYTAERLWFAEHDAYATEPETVGFKPERGNRYLYRLGAGRDEVIEADKGRFPEIDNGALDAALHKHVAQIGITGKCPDCSITIGCAGNVDGDDELDVWSISTVARGNIPAGTPYNHFNDVTGEASE
jgi:type IV pilus assembly protein PilA